MALVHKYTFNHRSWCFARKKPYNRNDIHIFNCSDCKSGHGQLNLNFFAFLEFASYQYDVSVVCLYTETATYEKFNGNNCLFHVGGSHILLKKRGHATPDQPYPFQYTP